MWYTFTLSFCRLHFTNCFNGFCDYTRNISCDIYVYIEPGKILFWKQKQVKNEEYNFFVSSLVFEKKKKNEVWNRTRHYFTGKHIAYYRSRDGLSARTSTHEFSSSFLSIKKKKSEASNEKFYSTFSTLFYFQNHHLFACNIPYVVQLKSTVFYVSTKELRIRD